MKTVGEKREGAEFRVNFEAGKPAPQYPEAHASGFTTVFRGYRENTGVEICQRFELEELEALVSAAQDAGLTSIKISLRGNLDKATQRVAKPKE